ncbi:hypothetical protein Nepgr_023819 [Nepenthes gracilis]|uniref:Uncharacterized protein n=1 Tax=Nepenthes gracilis TaxID=150966 RepID=A0AAD3XZU1_NEPGR|nr:hypothetical protein Nepgr_023819 [Nepenthes gracilis]
MRLEAICRNLRTGFWKGLRRKEIIEATGHEKHQRGKRTNIGGGFGFHGRRLCNKDLIGGHVDFLLSFSLLEIGRNFQKPKILRCIRVVGMDETEKMTALKKAYAEIILNTSKEAAARIMVSERKAHQFQHNLSSTKEEALRLLLRVKRMMDSKIGEAERISIIQQRRIEELEAQLQEAEDIVGNLRAELNDAQAELERLSNQQRPIDEPMMAKTACQEEKEQQEDGLKKYEFTMSPQASQPEGVTTFEPKRSEYLEQYCYVDNPNVASIILRNKELELCRNGCTQRIRAFERNLLNGNLCLSGELDDLKNEKLGKEGKEDDRICVDPAACTENVCMVEKTSAEVKEVTIVDKNNFNLRNCRRRKRKFPLSRKIKQELKCVPVQLKEAPEASCSQVCQTASENNLFKISNNKDSSNPQSVIEARIPSDLCGAAIPSEYLLATNSEEDKNFTVDEDMELVSSLVLICQENAPENDIRALSRDQTEMDNALVIDSDVKVSDASDTVASQAPNDRPLRYTFQRKRKRESLISDDGGARHEDSTLKRRTGKKQNGTLEAPKSSLIAESSRDSRRMAQVARQLISLSEKKWWQ